MGKITNRQFTKLIPPESDRHANKLDIYQTNSGLIHVNFRNIQIKLTNEDFIIWKRGFVTALNKLGKRMENDIPPSPKKIIKLL